MTRTLFSSEDLPPEHRFEQWCEVSARLRPTRLVTQHPDEFRGSIRALTLGAVRLAEVTSSPLLCHREPVHVRRDDPQDLQIHLVVQGTAAIDVDRRQETASPGEMLVHGSWHPYVSHMSAPTGLVRRLSLFVPRQALAVPPRWTDRLMGSRLPATGTGAVLADLLTRTFAAADQDGELHPREAVALGDAAVSLAAALIAHRAGTQAALPPQTRHRVLVQRVHAFIDAHLSDPALCPQAVADAHHISLRHLHRLFQPDGAGVNAQIRRRRLEKCRHDLADPALAGRPVHAIAARWGFAHAPDFTRAFRAAYGVTPSDYRDTALGGRDGAVR